MSDELATTLRPVMRTERDGKAFQTICLAAILAVLGLVTLGSVVRVTGSGLGCPDWPLCHGRIFPPLEAKALVEYSHRLVASLVSVLVIGVGIFAWISHKRERWVVYPAMLAVLTLVAQALLGGIVVLKELPSSFVMAHLAVAEALVAFLVVAYMAARHGTPDVAIWRSVRGRVDTFPLMALVAAVATYGLMLDGAYVVVSGASTACGQWWPLCLGRLMPEGFSPQMHLLHRGIGLLVGLLIVLVLVQAWNRRRLRPDFWWAALTVGSLFLVQVFVGAFNVWLGFPVATKALHLAAATAVWGALCALAVLAHTRPQSGVV